MFSLLEARTSKERYFWKAKVAELKRSNTNHKAKTATEENGPLDSEVAFTAANKS